VRLPIVRRGVEQLVLPPGMVLPGAGFDFLAGTYVRARRQRVSNIVCVGLVLVAMAALGVRGLSADLSARSAQQEVVSIRVSGETAVAKLLETLPGGISEEAVEAHMKTRASGAVLMLQNGFDPWGVLAAALRTAPVGVRIATLEVKPGGLRAHRTEPVGDVH
jgi:hypothetical protein